MIVSDHLIDGTDPLQGLPYYLPKAVIPVSIVGSYGSDASSKGGPSTAGATPAAGPSGGSTAAAKGTTGAPTATATASPQITVNVQPAPAAGQAGTEGSRGASSTYKLTITAAKPLFVPDPAEEYYLRYTPGPWSDDTLSLQVDSNGLLQSSKAQAVDQTAAVGTALVELAAVAAGFPGNINPALISASSVDPRLDDSLFKLQSNYQQHYFVMYNDYLHSIANLSVDGKLLQKSAPAPPVADKVPSLSDDYSLYHTLYNTYLSARQNLLADGKSSPSPPFPPPAPPKPPTPPTPLPQCILPSISQSFNYEPGYPGQQDDGSKAPETWLRDVANKKTSSTWLVASDPSGQEVRLTIEEQVVSPEKTAVTFNSDNRLLPDGSAPQHDPLGILFRDWAHWTITMTVTPNPAAIKACNIAKMQHRIRDLLIPNQGQKFWENMNRQSLINKQISLAVQNGMLTGVDPTRPSTILAWIKLPLTIIQPIISAPFQAIAGSKPAAPAATSGTAN